MVVYVITITIVTGEEGEFFVAVVIEGRGAVDLVADGVGVTSQSSAQSLLPSYPGWHPFYHAVEHTITTLLSFPPYSGVADSVSKENGIVVIVA